MEQGNKLETKRTRKWNGRYGEISEYRFATGVPIRADDGIRLNWVELRITHEETEEQIYKNSWVTNHAVAANCVTGIARAGRIRWKSENKNNNVLTTKGYHAKHNFGHGEKHLANTFLTLNVLHHLNGQSRDEVIGSNELLNLFFEPQNWNCWPLNLREAL